MAGTMTQARGHAFCLLLSPRCNDAINAIKENPSRFGVTIWTGTNGKRKTPIKVVGSLESVKIYLKSLKIDETRGEYAI
jgi:hypothetical protein